MGFEDPPGRGFRPAGPRGAARGLFHGALGPAVDPARVRGNRRGAELARRYHRRLSLTYSYNWLGEIYFYKGEHSKGLGYLQDALQQAREIRNAYREMELNGSLYACYHAMGDDSRALRYLRRSMEIRDSLQVEKNVRQIGLLHIQYETGRKDQEIASLAALNREKTKKGKLVTGALLLFALLSVFLFFLYRVLQDRNRRLTESNRKINEQAQQLQVPRVQPHLAQGAGGNCTTASRTTCRSSPAC